ncbi:hypothetical protein ABI59_20805 [Acidobacteria bacterium Mor1]|nr:hypothetical protein ABI59_20805 [Acidobacteria bacterium Mor1]
MLRRNLFMLIAVVLTAANALAEEAAPGKKVAAAIDAYLAPYIEADHLSGNLLVARGDQVIYERSFGWADRELSVPVTPETRFNVASVTKPMTVIALIDLIGAQKLTLADTLSKWIPDFPRGKEITIGHLARHRAGIPHRVTEPNQETEPRSAEDMARFAAQRPLTGEPGERYAYSSGGFSVLARVLELASGEDYNSLLQRAVFTPAGMKHSIHTDGRTLLPNRASAYRIGAEGSIVNAGHKDFSYLVGAGSVYSTARDLYAMLRAVRTGALGPGPQQSFVDDNGLDWNGVTGGFRAFADWHKESDVSVVFTGNLQTGVGNRIRRDVHRIAGGGEVATADLPKIQRAAVAASVLQQWEGIYQLRPGSELRVTARDGALFANEWTMIPVGPRRFWSPQDYAFVDVVTDDSGKPLRLDWATDGDPLPCPRLRDLDSE